MNTYSYSGQNPIINVDPYGLLYRPNGGGIGSLPFNWERSGAQIKEYFLDVIGYGAERLECETYICCTVRCVGAILGIEIATTGVKQKLEILARLKAKTKAAARIVGMGTFSTAYSGAEVVTCSWRCEIG